MGQREFYPELPSTQDRALQLARDGADEGSVVVARRQTEGRGRLDHRWASPAGGLYLSIVLRPCGPLLPLAIGVELADALAMEYGVRLRVKWPNDLLHVDVPGSARKLAGVIVDVVPKATGGDTTVAGIGVNARGMDGSAPAELRDRSVGLDELTGVPVDLGRLETVVARAAVTARRTLSEPSGARPVLARVRGLLYGAGEAVSVDGVPMGVLAGVRDDGALEVRGRDGLLAFVAGDVHVGVGR